ncbi:Histone-lysine N-methyltransferase set9 [Actinomortierella wolfii]|nr:Histone-lysine N-methyltransferase set9 [Actinomortierella wolfii]
MKLQTLSFLDDLLSDVILDRFLDFRTHKMNQHYKPLTCSPSVQDDTVQTDIDPSSASTGQGANEATLHPPRIHQPLASKNLNDDVNGMDELKRAVLDIIQTHVIANSRVMEAAEALLQIRAIKEVLEARAKETLHMEGEEGNEANFNDCVNQLMADFRVHAKRYLGLYLPKAGIEIGQTDRYTAVTNKSEACVTANIAFHPGDQLRFCTGTIAVLTEQEEKELEHDTKDFSVIRTSRRGTCLFLGPARFVNHDCDPNCEFIPAGQEAISFKVIKPIQVNEEITTKYGDNYFGPNNRECLCATCERLEQGAFSKNPRIEDDEESITPDILEDEEPITRRLRSRNGRAAAPTPIMITPPRHASSPLRTQSPEPTPNAPTTEAAPPTPEEEHFNNSLASNTISEAVDSMMDTVSSGLSNHTLSNEEITAAASLCNLALPAPLETHQPMAGFDADVGSSLLDDCHVEQDYGSLMVTPPEDKATMDQLSSQLDKLHIDKCASDVSRESAPPMRTRPSCMSIDFLINHVDSDGDDSSDTLSTPGEDSDFSDQEPETSSFVQTPESGNPRNNSTKTKQSTRSSSVATTPGMFICSNCEYQVPVKDRGNGTQCRRCERHFLIFHSNWPTRSKKRLLEHFERLRQAEIAKQKAEEMMKAKMRREEARKQQQAERATKRNAKPSSKQPTERDDKPKSTNTSTRIVKPREILHPFHQRPCAVFVDPQDGGSSPFWWPAITIPLHQMNSRMPSLSRYKAKVSDGQDEEITDENECIDDNVLVRYLEDNTYSVCTIEELKLFHPQLEPYTTYVAQFQESFLNHLAVVRGTRFVNEGWVPEKFRWKDMKPEERFSLQQFNKAASAYYKYKQSLQAESSSALSTPTTHQVLNSSYTSPASSFSGTLSSLSSLTPSPTDSPLISTSESAPQSKAKPRRPTTSAPKRPKTTKVLPAETKEDVEEEEEGENTPVKSKRRHIREVRNDASPRMTGKRGPPFFTNRIVFSPVAYSTPDSWTERVELPAFLTNALRTASASLPTASPWVVTPQPSSYTQKDKDSAPTTSTSSTSKAPASITEAPPTPAAFAPTDNAFAPLTSDAIAPKTPVSKSKKKSSPPASEDASSVLPGEPPKAKKKRVRKPIAPKPTSTEQQHLLPTVASKDDTASTTAANTVTVEGTDTSITQQLNGESSNPLPLKKKRSRPANTEPSKKRRKKNEDHAADAPTSNGIMMSETTQLPIPTPIDPSATATAPDVLSPSVITTAPESSSALSLLTTTVPPQTPIVDASGDPSTLVPAPKKKRKRSQKKIPTNEQSQEQLQEQSKELVEGQEPSSDTQVVAMPKKQRKKKSGPKLAEPPTAVESDKQSVDQSTTGPPVECPTEQVQESSKAASKPKKPRKKKALEEMPSSATLAQQSPTDSPRTNDQAPEQHGEQMAISPAENGQTSVPVEGVKPKKPRKSKPKKETVAEQGNVAEQQEAVPSEKPSVTQSTEIFSAAQPIAQSSTLQQPVDLSTGATPVEPVKEPAEIQKKPRKRAKTSKKQASELTAVNPSEGSSSNTAELKPGKSLEPATVESTEQASEATSGQPLEQTQASTAQATPKKARKKTAKASTGEGQDIEAPSKPKKPRKKKADKATDPSAVPSPEQQTAGQPIEQPIELSLSDGKQDVAHGTQMANTTIAKTSAEHSTVQLVEQVQGPSSQSKREETQQKKQLQELEQLEPQSQPQVSVKLNRELKELARWTIQYKSPNPPPNKDHSSQDGRINVRSGRVPTHEAQATTESHASSMALPDQTIASSNLSTTNVTCPDLVSPLWEKPLLGHFAQPAGSYSAMTVESTPATSFTTVVSSTLMTNAQFLPSDEPIDIVGTSSDDENDRLPPPKAPSVTISKPATATKPKKKSRTGVPDASDDNKENVENHSKTKSKTATSKTKKSESTAKDTLPSSSAAKKSKKKKKQSGVEAQALDQTPSQEPQPQQDTKEANEQTMAVIGEDQSPSQTLVEERQQVSADGANGADDTQTCHQKTFLNRELKALAYWMIRDSTLDETDYVESDSVRTRGSRAGLAKQNGTEKTRQQPPLPLHTETDEEHEQMEAKGEEERKQQKKSESKAAQKSQIAKDDEQRQAVPKSGQSEKKRPNKPKKQPSTNRSKSVSKSMPIHKNTEKTNKTIETEQGIMEEKSIEEQNGNETDSEEDVEEQPPKPKQVAGVKRNRELEDLAYWTIKDSTPKLSQNYSDYVDDKRTSKRLREMAYQGSHKS